jgi:ABC-type multidrug transport system ATPase subunit
MYTDSITIHDNQLLDNSVGVYTMYSRDVTIRDNLIRGHRGPSGYALGFKDADNVTVTGNVMVNNGSGIFLDGTPFTPQGFSRFEQNIIAFNDVAVIMQPAVKGNLFSNNTFWENNAQMTLQGGGTAGVNTWQNNTWSDYNGFDADGNGQGDVPYRSDRFFEDLMDEEPRLRVLLYSPAVQAIEMAARTFPLLRPQPKFVDETPQMNAAAIPPFAQLPPQPAGWLWGAAALFLTLALLGAYLGRSEAVMNKVNSKQLAVSSEQSAVSNLSVSQSLSLPLVIKNLSKSYGPVPALRHVTFEAAPGEAIALWGENGAGKSTLLKAILGLIEYQGEIQVQGHDGRKDGKAARRAIGYVPQEVLLSDWSVLATLHFFCRLKKADASRIPALLDKLGLTAHAQKAVPALSGGLRQRLALALALLADPPVLLLDEPTANLDTQARWDYLTLLAELRHDGKTILFASHRLEEVEALADRVLLLQQGEMLGLVNVDELRPRIQTEIPTGLQSRKGAKPHEGNGVVKHPVWQPTTPEMPVEMVNGQ